mgnify:CR=1 FL=1
MASRARGGLAEGRKRERGRRDAAERERAAAETHAPHGAPGKV